MTSLIFIAVAFALIVIAVRMSRRPAPPPGWVPARPKRQLRRDVPHALYRYPHRFLPGSVYYGISNDPEARDKRHERESWWYRRLSTQQMIVIRWYPDWATAREAERDAIRAAAYRGEPIENIEGNPLRKAVRRAA